MFAINSSLTHISTKFRMEGGGGGRQKDFISQHVQCIFITIIAGNAVSINK